MVRLTSDGSIHLRAILHEQLQFLRAGKHPEVVRSAVSRWHGILGEIKRLAGNL